MSTGYLISSLAWSLVGFVLGRVTVSVEQIRRKMDVRKMPEGTGAVDPLVQSTDMPSRKQSVLHRPSGAQIIGAVVVAMALITMIVVFAQTSRLNTAITCNNSAYKEYSEAFKARDDATVQSRANAREWASALNTLVSNILTRDPGAGTPSPEDRAKLQGYLIRFQNSTNQYIGSIDHSTQVRAVNPLPDRICGSS